MTAEASAAGRRLHDSASTGAALPTSFRILVWLVWLITGNAQAATPVTLTAEERHWLATQPQVLRRGADPGWPPFEYRDGRGAYAGMCQDYSELVAARLGVTIEVVAGLDWETILERMRRRELDVISCLVKTPERSAYLAFSKPYTTIPAVIYTRDDSPYVGSLRDLAGRRVMTIRGYAITEFLRQEYPGLELVIADLMMTGLALGAAAASADKRQGDAVTGFPETDMGADFLDRSAEFVAGNLGQLHVRIMTLPGMPVAATDAAGLNLEHDAVSIRQHVEIARMIGRLRQRGDVRLGIYRPKQRDMACFFG